MNILVIFVLALLSTTLAKSKDGRKPKVKHQPADEDYRNPQDQGYPFPVYNSDGSFLGFRENHRIPHVDAGIRENPKIPHVDEAVRENLRIPHVDARVHENTRIPQVDAGMRENLRIPHVVERVRENLRLPHVDAGVSENPRIRHVEEVLQDKLRIPYVNKGNREKPITLNDKNKRRRYPRQSFITIQVPAGSSGGQQSSGGDQLSPTLQYPGISSTTNLGSGGFHQGPPIQYVESSQAGSIQQDTSLQFQVDPQGSHHHGDQGIPVVPGDVISGLNNGGGSILHPGVSGFSAGVGPGGLSPHPDTGLAGGLGGVYGGGYGFGLGGLIFGGPAGPVFAGNMQYTEGLGAINEDDTDQTEAPPTPLPRPAPSRGNFFRINDGSIKSQVNRGPTIQLKMPHHPDVPKNAPKNSNASSGETIGYVAFIFPRRSLNNPQTPTAEHPRGTQKPTTEPAKPKIRAKVQPIINRLALCFLPLPLHIPVGHSFPVSYAVAKPIHVPIVVPKPVSVDILLGLDGKPLFLQPSFATKTIHKRSDNAAKPS